jgi:HK97 family phage prohead protease
MAGIAIDSGGRFSGYASVFNRVDSGGDIVMPGAFAKSLATRRDRIRLLFQHDPKEPVGIWEAMGEDSYGLFVSGRLVPGVERADALKRLIENGALDGLSIGFRTVKATREAGKRKLWQIDLFEISIVTFPMMEDARIAPSSLSTGAAIAAATQTIRNR